MIATGQRTGDSATLSEIDEIRAATALPLLVGSGVTPDNVCQILGRTQGDCRQHAESRWRVVEPGGTGAREALHGGGAGCAGGGVMESFSDRLLTQHQALWQAMQQHRFVVDIEHDRLPDSVFNRYLVFEGNFVATAIAILRWR